MQNSIRLILALTAFASTNLCDAQVPSHGSQKSSQTDLFTMNIDGTDLTWLTFDVERETDPAWSPDGKRIAFSAVHLSNDILVVNSDGSGLTNLTNYKDRSAFSPAWSPDGSALAYAGAANDEGKLHIFIRSLDGTEELQLTTGEPRDRSPAWSPDGKTIAFSRGKQGYSDICLVDLGSGETTFVTSNEDTGYHAVDPSWSPDGKHIAHVLSKGHMNRDIHIIDLRDGRTWQITTNGLQNARPAWSPNGRQLVFSALNESRFDTLYVVDSDGSNMREIPDTADKRLAMYPDWSPDGKRFVFVRNYPLASPPEQGPGAVVIYESGLMRYDPPPTDLPPWSYATEDPDGELVYQEITPEEGKVIMRRLGIESPDSSRRRP